MATKPLVAIVGRPNVGKSTLFNRIIGQRLAIVDDRPGTTRDRLYADTVWNGVEFALVDTGGLDFVKANPHERHGSEIMHEYNPRQIQQMVSQQAQVAIAEADAIILVVSITDSVTAGDREVAEQLRRSGKPVILATNKADNLKRELDAMEFYQLGLSEPLSISALHGNGTGDLLDQVVATLPKQVAVPDDGSLKIAIVGRPNVGKSSLLNALLGQERMIVSPIPGTTRDSIDTGMTWDGHPITLIDTAGIRRRGHIAHGEVEQYSVLRALRAIQRCDVALLIADGADGITAQDAHVASYILEEHKGAVIVVNKWDLVEKETDTMAIYKQQALSVMDFMAWAPLVFVSAKTKRRIQTVMEAALQARAGRQLRVPTSELNELVRDATTRHAPPSKHGKRLRFFYATQPSSEPPTFVFFVSDTDMVHFSYQRYLENLIRDKWGFVGTPLRMNFRKREKGDE